MPFCPKCGVEYRAGFTRCTDCDVDLVETLDEEVQWAGGDPVEVTRRQNPAEARMICEALEGEGIPCLLRGAEGKDMLGSMLGASIFDGGTLNDVIILVPEERLAQAEEIVGAFFPNGEFTHDVEFLECSECGCPVDPEDEVCPGCGAELSKLSDEGGK